MRKLLYVIVAVFGVFAALSLSGTSVVHSEAASATINSFVDTSVNSSTISFGNLDPGTSNNSATENAITLTNTANSNTAVDIYLQSQNLTSGGFTIGVSNLKVSKTSGGAKTSLVEATANWLNGAGPNQGYYEGVAKSGTADFYFWLDVPAGQDAGAYTGTLTIKTVKDGNTP